MLTESLFADECEPFFNSIGHKRTNHRGPKHTFVGFDLPAQPVDATPGISWQ
jgi:hypothetical protein